MVDTWTSPKRDFVVGDTVGVAAWLNGHGQDLDHLKQRLDGLSLWTNTGAQVTVGGLLIADTATGDYDLKPSTASAGQAGPFWVALTSFGTPGPLTGYAAQSGYALLNYTGAAPARGDRLQASATAAVAQVGTANSFATAIAAGASGQVAVLLDGPPSLAARLLTTLGDLLYRDATGLARLAGNTTATKKFLRQTGTGAVSAAPAWDTLVLGDLPTVPSARAYHSAAQGIANTPVWTTLALDSERWDTDTIHDLVTNNSRLTCKTAGKYDIKGHVRFAATSTTGSRGARILLNGTTQIAIDVKQALADVNFNVTYLTATTTFDLAVNDYVELQAWQDSASNPLNVDVSGFTSPEFMMTRLSA